MYLSKIVDMGHLGEQGSSENKQIGLLGTESPFPAVRTYRIG